MTEGRLRDAIAQHQAQEAAGHLCGRPCYASIAAAAAVDPGALAAAWLEHWQNDPEWRWNTYAMADTDHHCGPSCAKAIASRLANRF